MASKVAIAEEERNGGVPLDFNCLGLHTESVRTNHAARELGNVGENRIFGEYYPSASQVYVYLHIAWVCV